jgi:hypothetical protein
MAISTDKYQRRLEQLEAEVARLKREMQAAESAPVETMAALYGIWAGQIKASEADFEAVEFSMRWLDEPVAAR